MSFAYMPLYTGDYIRDTTDLSPREHGAYLMMLMWCWQRAKPMPNDMQRICRIVNARDEEDEKAVLHVLSEFFVLGDDGCYHNNRLEEEIKRSNTLSTRGKAGASARWGKVNGHEKKCLSDAKPMQDGCLSDAKPMAPSPSPSPSTNSKSSTKSGSPKKASAGPDVTRPDEWNFKEPPKPGLEAEYVLACFNKVTDSRYRAVDSTLRLIRARLTEHTVPAMKKMIVYMTDKWEGDEKMSDYIRPQTFFAAANCQSYIEQARKAYGDQQCVS